MDAMAEDVCINAPATAFEACPSSARTPSELEPQYDISFSENNPSLTWQDRTPDANGGLKEIFSKFDANLPVCTELLSRARFLCARYLGGAWARVKLSEFRLKAITGGLSNLLFLVELPSSHKPIGSEPKQALLRIHCQSDLEQLLSESVVFTLLSERSLGPKLLGVFPGGRFEQFIPSRPLECFEISKPSFARLIGPMVARVHTLDVPITKEPEILGFMRMWLDKFRQTPGARKPIEIYCTRSSVDPSEFPASVTVEDLEKELAFVERFLAANASPVVFSHNDLQEGNILLADGCTVNEDSTITKLPEVDHVDPLVLIDFEYCNYNYRGFDLGNHFCEYGYDYNCTEPPYYKIHQDKFDVIEERQIFCEAYLDEVYRMRNLHDNPHFPSDLVTGNRNVDLEKLIQESRLYMPISNIFWVFWALYNAEASFITSFDYARYGRDRLALYYHQRSQLQEFLDKHQ